MVGRKIGRAARMASAAARCAHMLVHQRNSASVFLRLRLCWGCTRDAHMFHALKRLDWHVPRDFSSSITELTTVGICLVSYVIVLIYICIREQLIPEL